MSEELNQNIREFFIKIGEDIKTAFEECCPCICINKARVRPLDTSNIDNQSSHVIVQIEEDEGDLKVDNYVLEDNVIVRKNKVSYYYDCKDFYGNETETETETKAETKCVDSDYYGNEPETETKCVDSDCSEDDFVIIF